MASMVFSSSVLANIDKASIYRLVFIISIVGIGIFNLIDLMLRFIKQINIGYESAGSASRYILKINMSIALIILVDIIAWLVYLYRFG